MEGAKPWTDKRDDAEVLADAIQSCAQRVNEAFARLQRVEQQLNLQASVDLPSQIIKRLDTVLSENLYPLFNHAEKLHDPLVSQQVDLTFNALLASRELVYLSQTSKKPSDPSTLTALLQPISTCVAGIHAISAQNSSTKSAPLLAAFAAGADALDWFASHLPHQHIATHKANVKKLPSPYDAVSAAFLALLDNLQNAVEAHLRQGLVWRGNREAPPVLSWNMRHVVPGTRPLYKALKELNFFNGTGVPADQTVTSESLGLAHLFGYTALKNNIKVKAAEEILIESCSFITVEISSSPISLRLKNCSNVTVTCKDSIKIVEVDGSNNCVLSIKTSEVASSNSTNTTVGSAALPPFTFKVKGAKLKPITK